MVTSCVFSFSSIVLFVIVKIKLSSGSGIIWDKANSVLIRFLATSDSYKNQTLFMATLSY